jgi:hypothetical protein
MRAVLVLVALALSGWTYGAGVVGSGEFAVSRSTTPAVPGWYYVTAPCTISVPTVSIGGDVVIVNLSAGAVLIGPGALTYGGGGLSLNPGATAVLHWSTLYNQMVIE